MEIGDRPLSTDQPPRLGPLWGALCKLLLLYWAISKVVLGDGRRTKFWEDSWLPRGTLCVTMPTFSHT